MELAVRREIAGQLLLDGNGIREVARIVNASPSSVKRWKDALQIAGLDSLQPKPHPGRSPRLTRQQQEHLVSILEKGALAAGYATDQWTCPRIADVIERRFQVKYHADHVRRVLHALGWTSQKPEQRAREGDEAEIEQWRRQTWPRIKKGPRKAS
jgi:transposase